MKSSYLKWPLVIVFVILLSFTLAPLAHAYPAGYRLPFEGSVTVTSGPTSDESPYHKNHSAEAMDFWTGTKFQVYAVAAGKAYFLPDGKTGGFGNVILIQHNDGNTSFYAHLDRAVVGGGQMVDQGTYIGNAGNTGTISIHLHFEIRSNVAFDGQHFPYLSGDPVRIVDHPNIDYEHNPVCCNRGTAIGEPVGSVLVDSTVCLIIDVDVANLRSGPGSSFGVVGAARRNERFPIVTRAGSGSDRWYEIGISDGRRAWISSSIVRLCPFNGNVDDAIPEQKITGPVSGIWIWIRPQSYQRCDANINRIGHAYQIWSAAITIPIAYFLRADGALVDRTNGVEYQQVRQDTYEYRRENAQGSIATSTIIFRSQIIGERFSSQTGCATAPNGKLHLLAPFG